MTKKDDQFEILIADEAGAGETPASAAEEQYVPPRRKTRYRLELNAEEWELIIALAEAEGQADMDSLKQTTGLEEEKLERVLSRLEEKGIVSRQISEPEQTAQELTRYLESLAAKNYYEILGVSPNAERSQIRQAYYTLIRRYHPNRYFGHDNEKTRQVAKEIFILLTKAYDTLADNKRRQEYDESIPELAGTRKDEEFEDVLAVLAEGPQEEITPLEQKQNMARQFYQTALEDFRLGDYRSADINFKLAAAMDATNAEYREAMLKTQRILARQKAAELKQRAARLEKEGKIQAALNALKRIAELTPDIPEPLFHTARLQYEHNLNINEALAHVERALTLAPDEIDYLLLKGRILARLGSTEKARETFRRVLLLAPECRAAREELEASRQQRDHE